MLNLTNGQVVTMHANFSGEVYYRLFHKCDTIKSDL